MEWYTKGVFFLQKWYVKGKEWDLQAGLPRIKLYWGPPGGVNLLNYCMTVCDSGHRKVFVFHINQVNLWAPKYLNFLSVQTNHSFYTGVRIRRNGGVPPHLINNFFAGGPSVRDGGVHSLWFLSSEQYQSFVLKIQQFLRLRSLITLSFQDGEQRLK